MSMHGRFILFCVGLPLLALPSCSTSEESETRPAGTNVLSPTALSQAQVGTVDFTRHVKPILEAKCATCHNQEAPSGKMSLANRTEAHRTGGLRRFIIPGQPEASPLIMRLGESHATVQAMPPVGESLTKEETAVIKRWISQGASWPAGPKGQLRTATE
ncbi:c-type cytochrome domain-containing protein [Prosthecobacter dejongeii]|uniref:Putative membrane protein n=1 Tax=Prosthecobacter dejongeii TaxID=48465 RepID=A0A7W7YKF5_9BACT|nr:c-type cytochrome domain-containing protein [Prosthecobacter dejongeii]MBB5037853.1 putative membrane protein [Prosthecobacter dejongeii]